MAIIQQLLNSVESAENDGPSKTSRLSGREKKAHQVLLVKQKTKQDREEQALLASVCDTTEITDSVKKEALHQYRAQIARFEAFKQAQRDGRAAALSQAMS